jgi:hypothetical protein
MTAEHCGHSVLVTLAARHCCWRVRTRALDFLLFGTAIVEISFDTSHVAALRNTP